MKHITLVKALILFTILLFAFSLYQRPPDVDDAWIGEHAYWMAKNGFVKSELMHGITGQDVRHIVHHKIFTLNGALFIKIFGFSLMTLKSVSLLWLCVFLIIFTAYVKRTIGTEAAWFALLITLFNSLIFQYSFVFRPEIMVMTLGFISYLFLEKAIEGGYENKLLIFSGLFAGLAAATHLNGLIFMGAGAILLWWNRNFKASIVFACATLPAFAVYFYDFSVQYGIQYWLYQINDSPALHKSAILPSSLSFLAKMLNEHMRFFHSPKEISFSLLFLFLLVINYKYLKTARNLLRYLLLMVVLLSLVAVHSTSKYILLYLPYILLIIIRSFEYLYRNRDNRLPLRWNFNSTTAYCWALGLLSLYLVINTAWNVHISVKKSDPDKNHQLALKYMGRDTGNLNILAPMTFIFNEMGNFRRIQSDLSIAEMKKSGNHISGPALLNYADSMNIDYLIITDEYKERFGISKLSTVEIQQHGYSIAGNEPGILILKSRQLNSNE